MASLLFFCAGLRAPKKTCDISEVQYMIAIVLLGFVFIYDLLSLWL